MNTPVKLQGNSGSGLRWIVHTDASSAMLPAIPQRYAMALKMVSLTGFDFRGHETTSFGHVVISYDALLPTYLALGQPIAAVKTFIIDGRDIRHNYTQEMEFYNVDFTNNSTIRIKVVNDKGEEINVKGTFLFELHEI